MLRASITVLASSLPKILGILQADYVFKAYDSIMIFNNILKTIEVIVFIAIIGIIIYKDFKEVLSTAKDKKAENDSLYQK